MQAQAQRTAPKIFMLSTTSCLKKVAGQRFHHSQHELVPAKYGDHRLVGGCLEAIQKSFPRRETRHAVSPAPRLDVPCSMELVNDVVHVSEGQTLGKMAPSPIPASELVQVAGVVMHDHMEFTYLRCHPCHNEISLSYAFRPCKLLRVHALAI